MAAVAAVRCPIPGRHPIARAVRGFFVCRGRCGRRSGRIVPVGRRSGRRTRDRYVGVRRKARPEKRRPQPCGRGAVFRGAGDSGLCSRRKYGLWRLRSGMFVPIAGRGGNGGCRRAEDGVGRRIGEGGPMRRSSRRVAPGRITRRRRRRAPAVRAGSRRRRSRSGRTARPGCRVRRIRRRCPAGGRGVHGPGH